MLRKNLLSFSLLCTCLTTSCGYRLHNPDPIALSIPYVPGDTEQLLTSALVREIASSPCFRYVGSGESQWTLKVKLVDKANERIGFRYDQTNSPGFPLKKNLVGTEDRCKAIAQVSLVDAFSGEEVCPPRYIQATTEYDYVNSSSLEDLSFVITDGGGKRATSLNTSLGQLDGVDQANLDAHVPLYQQLAQKIIESISQYEKIDAK